MIRGMSRKPYFHSLILPPHLAITTFTHVQARGTLPFGLPIDWRTGLRRAELSNLEVKDIHSDFLVVRSGKGKKDRIIPLTPSIAEKLHNFTKEIKPNEKVFKLNPTSLGMKIKDLAKRAGLNDFHCHSLRHKFATDLLDHGADIRAVQQLLGHTNLNTTQVYLSITDKSLREAVNRLESKPRESIRSETKLQEMLQKKILLYKPTSDIGLAYRILLDQFRAQQPH